MTRRTTISTMMCAATVAALALLTGCNNQSSTSGGETASTAPAASGAAASGGSGGSGGSGKKIIIAWAEWTPAQQLQKLCEDYTKETGTAVEVQQIPWDNYETKIQTAWSAQDPTYDLIVGDSQWLGKGATQGHYVELTDWVKTNVKMDDIAASAVSEYGEYPAKSGKLWGLPCENDATVFAYRKDLFEDPANKAAFKAKYGKELAPPDTWDDFKNVAEFFTQPDKQQYGAALFYSGYDGATMGYDQILWAFGGNLSDPTGKKIEGVLNNDKGLQALQFYVDLKKSTPPGSETYYFSECLRDFQEGKVAMAQSWFAFLPDLVDPKKNGKYLDKTGYFIIPKGPAGRFVSLGGQGLSISAYSKQQDEAKKFMAWFEKQDTQLKWAKLGGLTANKNVAASDDFKKAAPFNVYFTDSVPYLKDFYNTPNYAELLHTSQTDINNAVAGQMTAKAAIDDMAKSEQASMDGEGK